MDFQEPATRKEFWIQKINANIERDKKVNTQLKDMGWMVIRIWEHEIKKNSSVVIETIREKLLTFD